MSQISIIMPVLNEGQALLVTLEKLKPVLNRGNELIVVDGGSHDNTVSIAEKFTDKCFTSKKGRATQMNFGASHSTKDILLFLHADTTLPDNADELIHTALNISKKYQWGHFNVKLTGSHLLLRFVEKLMNFRSRITSIATGDQVIFVQKKLFEDVNGYAEIPLMEDIDLSIKLKKYTRARVLPVSVISSSRRWEENGYIKTILLMWKLRLLYYFGMPATKLVNLYYK